jgi:hypothetical protein
VLGAIAHTCNTSNYLGDGIIKGKKSKRKTYLSNSKIVKYTCISTKFYFWSKRNVSFQIFNSDISAFNDKKEKKEEEEKQPCCFIQTRALTTESTLV